MVLRDAPFRLRGSVPAASGAQLPDAARKNGEGKGGIVEAVACENNRRRPADAVSAAGQMSVNSVRCTRFDFPEPAALEIARIKDRAHVETPFAERVVWSGGTSATQQADTFWSGSTRRRRETLSRAMETPATTTPWFMCCCDDWVPLFEGCAVVDVMRFPSHFRCRFHSLSRE